MKVLNIMKNHKLTCAENSSQKYIFSVVLVIYFFGFVLYMPIVMGSIYMGNYFGEFNFKNCMILKYVYVVVIMYFSIHCPLLVDLQYQLVCHGEVEGVHYMSNSQDVQQWLKVDDC